jgi:hypothetical protein
MGQARRIVDATSHQGSAEKPDAERRETSVEAIVCSEE